MTNSKAKKEPSVFIKVRASVDERDRWKTKALEAGSTVSQLMRDSMDRVRTWTAADRQAAKEQSRELARIGSNLNQIARWANTHKQGMDAALVIAELVAIREEMEKFNAH